MSKLFGTVGKIGGGIVGAYFGGPAGAAVGSSVGGAVGEAIDGNSKKSKKTETAQTTQSAQTGGIQSLATPENLKLAMSLINQSGGTNKATNLIQALGSGSSDTSAAGGITDLVSKLFVS